MSSAGSVEKIVHVGEQKVMKVWWKSVYGPTGLEKVYNKQYLILLQHQTCGYIF